MKIKHLHIENLTCFTSRTLDFGDLTVIYGANRTGKSSCVYGLYYAIYGQHLNSGLRAQDLIRKGKKNAKIRLDFQIEEEFYTISRSTEGKLSLRKNSEELGNTKEDVEELIKLHPDLCSLTSFFRESELIRFLEDIPKYDNTLIQDLIGIGNLKITEYKFKKTLKLAKEISKRLTLPKGPSPDIKRVEASKKKLAETKEELKQVEDEYMKFLEYQNRDIDPNLFKVLKSAYESAKNDYEAAIKKRKKFPPIQDLEKQKEKLEKLARFDKESAKRGTELQNELVRLNEKSKDIDRRLRRFMSLENQATCPVCNQNISKSRVSNLIKELEKDSVKILQEIRATEEEWKKINKKQREYDESKIALEKVIKDLEEVKWLEGEIKRYLDAMTKSEDEIRKLEKIHGSLGDVEKAYFHKEKLRKEQEKLRNFITELTVDIRTQEKALNERKEQEKKMKAAERACLLCDIAHQAAQNTIRTLSAEVLTKVKKSIPKWLPQFTFLKDFDIEMSPGELIPIIHAKGYAYKLRQMSKSERIFLYLLLKLSIGDALGHLGAFVLDDPADGLDSTQKKTLAYLLVEISKSRQVIVTTNDESFAGLFSEVSLINL